MAAPWVLDCLRTSWTAANCARREKRWSPSRLMPSSPDRPPARAPCRTLLDCSWHGTTLHCPSYLNTTLRLALGQQPADTQCPSPQLMDTPWPPGQTASQPQPLNTRTCILQVSLIKNRGSSQSHKQLHGGGVPRTQHMPTHASDTSHCLPCSDAHTHTHRAHPAVMSRWVCMQHRVLATTA